MHAAQRSARRPAASTGVATTLWAQDGNNPWVGGLYAPHDSNPVKVVMDLCAELLLASRENKVKIG